MNHREQIYKRMCVNRHLEIQQLVKIVQATNFMSYEWCQARVLSDLHAVVNTIKLPAWNEVRDELLKTYGGADDYDYDYLSSKDKPCQHEFNMLFNSRDGFCKHCNIDGQINDDGVVVWS